MGITTDRIVKKCRRCNGTGIIYEQTGKTSSKRHKCKRCNGTGIILKIA